MKEQNVSSLPLTPYRVLDLTDEKGYFCGKVLGDFGADVIKIERPGGDPSRNKGPFYHNIPHPERSLSWFACNINKRSITLNIESLDGQEIFKRLVKNAHFIVESFPPGYMEKVGLDYTELEKLNPRIILVSITPFGQTGPCKDYKASDIVYMGMGGMMYISGDPDRAPIRISVEQSYFQAGAQAASAAMIAHYHRQMTGEGQKIDLSIHESVVCSTHLTSFFWEIGGKNVRREGDRVSRGTVSPRMIWHCKDGYISWRIWVAQQGSRTRALVEWANSEGKAEELKDLDWEKMDFNHLTQERLELWEKNFIEFFLTHTKTELYEGAIKRGIILFPINTVKDLREDIQLQWRDFWLEVEHKELADTITYPGAPIKSSEFDCQIRYRPPLIGEHNEDIYHYELGITQEELVVLKEGGCI
ncbi:MAG: CoA transferase [Desulfobacterales bacterium]|nr:CoA transferase [Desulfobacterales bacterium]